jgi:hypothetical protein
MTPPEKACPGAGRGTWSVGRPKPTHYERGCHRPIFPHYWLKAERLRQSLLVGAGRGDLLKKIIDRIELRPNGLRMILSLIPLTPAAAPRTDRKVASSPESFRCGSSAAEEFGQKSIIPGTMPTS